MTSEKKTGAEMLLNALADAGVRYCFANPGTSELDLVLGLDHETRIKPVLTLFEGVASGAADGVYRMTGAPAATLLHLGPGYLNAAANLHNAARAHSPLINIVGDHAVSHRAFDTPLSSDLDAITAPHSVFARRVDEADFAAADAALAVKRAYSREGPATLLVSADAAWGAVKSPRSHDIGAFEPDAPAARVDAAAAALRRAEKPAILVGATGLSETGLKACARLATAGMRILAEPFPARHARGAGRFMPEKLAYFTEMAVEQLAGTDVMVLAGVGEPAGMFAYPNRPARPLPAECATVSLGGAFRETEANLTALADAIGAQQADPGKSQQDAPGKPTGALTPETLAASLCRHLPEHAAVSDDGVTASHFASAATAGAKPHDWMTLTGGALGQGMPLAIGASIAAPDRKTVCLTGDGAMLYTNQALWTIAREGLDVVIVVAVNRTYEILRFELSRMEGANPGAAARDLLGIGGPDISYVKLAEALGVEAVSCTTAEGFDDAFAQRVSSRGPSLIEAVYG